MVLPLLTPVDLARAATTVAPPSTPLLAHLVDEDRDGRSGIAVTTLTTGLQRVIVPEVGPGVALSDVQLSPDGRTIAFVRSTSSASGQVTELQLAAVDGSSLRTVGGLLNPHGPGWSPDGGTLVVSEGPHGVDPDLVLVPVAGGAAPSRVPGAVGTQPAFSRDGSRLAFVSPANTLSVIATTGGSPIDSNLSAFDPAWSPVEDRIVYSALDRLATVAAPTPADPAPTPQDVVPTVVGAHPGIGPDDDVRHPSWSNDARTLYLEVDHRTSASGPVVAAEVDAVLAKDGHGDSLRRVRASATGSYAAPSFRGPVPPPVVSGVRSVFTPVSPVRVLRTLPSAPGMPGTPLGPQGVRDVVVTGMFTTSSGEVVSVPADATAVVLNVTSVNATQATDVRVYPTPLDASFPPVSNINVQPGQSTPNLVTVAVTKVGGTVRLRNTAGTTDLLADLSGYFTAQVPGGAGSLFNPLAPARILHTASGSVGVLTQAKVVAGGHVDLKVIGSLPVRTLANGSTPPPVVVPAGTTAVVLNVTAFNATAPTDVRVYPKPKVDSAAPPEASNLNVAVPGVSVANLVVVKVGDLGKVRLYNRAGATDLAADIAGYYGGAGGAVFVPVEPQRLLSTIYGIGRTGYDHTPLAAKGVTDAQITGARAIPPSAVAVTLNVTGVGPTTSTDLRAYPSDYPNPAGTPPAVSTLNLRTGQTRANLAVVRVGAEIAGEEAVRVSNTAGTVGLILDISGYYVSS